MDVEDPQALVLDDDGAPGARGRLGSQHPRRTPPVTARATALMAVLVAGLVLVATPAEAAPATAEELGLVVFSIGESGGSAGYSSGGSPQYGALLSGTFLGGLFDDAASRTVAESYEDADDWLSDQEALDEITMEVTYEGSLDTRTFVLGGFIASRPGNRGLIAQHPPPNPQRARVLSKLELVSSPCALRVSRAPPKSAVSPFPQNHLLPASRLRADGWPDRSVQRLALDTFSQCG